MKNRLIIIFTLFITIKIAAQQDPQFTQYMYNMSVINPAYTTDNLGVLNLGGLFRTQWVGMVGAPTTSTFFIHTPVSEKIELGISFMNDEIGDIVNENSIYADFAYKIDLEEHGNLSFGIKAGATLFDVNFSDFQLESGDIFTDDSFEENINRSFLNIGTGIFYNTDKYYVGLSVPNILKSKHIDRSNGQYSGIEEAHVFLTGGYVFDINESLKFKPAFMTKVVKGSPTTLDITGNVQFNNRLEFGLGYRLDDAVSGLIRFNATPELKIGYAYDHTTSNLGPFNSGSHEFFILYDLDVFGLNKGYNVSPRFF